MAQFTGFKCDKCGGVIDGAARTKVTIKLEGVVNGQYHRDLCPECVEVPEGTEIRPLRKRRLGPTHDVPQEALSAPGVAQAG